MIAVGRLILRFYVRVFYYRLDDLSPLHLLAGLKELSLDGNPLTFNTNYVLYAVSSISSLVLLDQNVISTNLRIEADTWASHRMSGSTTNVNCLMDPAKVKPIVTVQHKSGGSAAIGTGIKSSVMPSHAKFQHQRNVAVVRPMSAHLQSSSMDSSSLRGSLRHQQSTMEEPDAAPLDPPLRRPSVPSAQPSSASAIKSCLVRSDNPRRKSFRQIAFSAMVCNAAAPRPSPAADDSEDRPIFRFSLRPPTAEWNEKNERTGKRSNSSSSCSSRRRNRSRAVVEFEDSSSSWNSDSDDSDTGSTVSTQSRKPTRSPTRVSTAPTGSSTAGSSSRGGGAGGVVASSSSSASNNKSLPTANQKLSATIGMNIKEQLRDLRIIVGEEEVHITGLNIVRMLHGMHWTADEVELFHTLVFYGLSFDQLGPYYASLRTLFPNLRNFAFRKVSTPPSLRHINSLAQLESPTWFRWTLSVETLSPAVEPSRAAWKSYAIYRLHPFGLDQIDGRQIGAEDVTNAEDQYDTLDSLVMLTAPSAAIRRQLDRFSSLDTGQTSSSSSSGSSDLSGAAVGQQRDSEYSLLMRKRAIRAIFQPLKVCVRALLIAPTSKPAACLLIFFPPPFIYCLCQHC